MIKQTLKYVVKEIGEKEMTIICLIGIFTCLLDRQIDSHIL